MLNSWTWVKQPSINNFSSSIFLSFLTGMEQKLCVVHQLLSSFTFDLKMHENQMRLLRYVWYWALYNSWEADC
jgi:hypothetical protein